MKQAMVSCGVVGAGFVGGSLATVLSERSVNVYQFDKAGKKSPGVNVRTFLSLGEMVQHCEAQDNFTGVFFVCLPTPMMTSGECDLSIVEGALRALANVPRDAYAGIPGPRIAVVKSTVPPGSVAAWNKMFASQLEVVHSPEFLREATALDDMRNQDRIVLGGSEAATAQVEKLFVHAFPGVPVIRTTSTTSEMVKYTANCFLSTKVSFANEMYQICQQLGISYNEMIGIATLDKRLGTSHWQVPGPMIADDGSGRQLKGFGGSCFVKDLNALINKAKKLGVIPTVLQAVWNKNLEVRPERDWEKLAGRAVSVKTKMVKPGLKIPMTNIQFPMLDLDGMRKEMLQRVFGA